ncbi:putative ABC transport system ATP-binding protein [Actinacidiphila yanglinensis]|uniref:Putative ABC transport system ATP-binding protein n=1 Tax=Actinacidiphila yanglinensis TaxID=310779 RepID=A0A1H5T822_9ACTN|nr:ABC transporter ATP-binding protein [Actinacidiphila yanglinensis]SEF59002.1 putative ABC transport system ATP-binding protein [Actinacidiphila yanglinensis]
MTLDALPLPPRPATASPAAPPPPPPEAGRHSPRALLWGALRAQRKDLVAASALYSSHQLGESMVPVLVGATVSEAIAGGGRWAIAWWLSVLAADFVLLSLSYRYGARASMRAKQHTGHVVRMWVTERVLRPAGGIRLAPGDLLTRAASDAGRVGAFAGVVAQTVAAVAVLAVATALLLGFSLLLGAVILLGTALLLVVQDRVARRLRRHSGAEQHEAGKAAVLAEDLVRGMRVLKGIRAERTAAADYRTASQAALGASLRAMSSQSLLSAVGTAFTGVYLTVIAGVGGWLTLSGRIGLGEFVAALGLARFVVGPMQVVSGASAAYARAVASAGRVLEVTGTREEVRDGLRPGGFEEGRGARVEVAGVEVDGFSGVSFVAECGELTGVVVDAPGLAGRIPELLVRESEPAAGRVEVGGKAVGEVPLERLRARVLVSPHDAVLFPGTLAENIALLAPDAKAAEQGTWAAFADQVIDTVPGGADATVGDRGESLSGGQRQRVALARAVAATPPVLVLHDPTTAVDAATEDRIAGRLRQVRAQEGLTSLLVTTSPALLSRCDRVFFLHGAAAYEAASPGAPTQGAAANGRAANGDPVHREAGDADGSGADGGTEHSRLTLLITDSGTHAGLMRDNAAYRELLTR